VTVFKAQFFIVYIFAAVAKLNPDWLRGEPHTTSLMHSADKLPPFVAHVVATPWFCHLITCGGIAIDSTVGFLLWFPQTFFLGALASLSFHLINSMMFQIGIFPWLMIAAIGIFAKPSWPRVLFPRKKKIARATADATNDAGVNAGTVCNAFDLKGLGKKYPSASVRCHSALNLAVLTFLHLYFVIQATLPLVHFLYPGEPSWTEQGFRFSWSMMMRLTKVQDFHMIATDPRTGVSTDINFDKVLNRLQFRIMTMRPDLVIEMAHKVADSIEQQFHVRPIITVKDVVSHNYRPAQDLINPEVDLAVQPIEFWPPAQWIVPLKPLK
jgi:vitamin K-dependent gamma-carboxylase